MMDQKPMLCGIRTGHGKKIIRYITGETAMEDLIYIFQKQKMHNGKLIQMHHRVHEIYSGRQQPSAFLIPKYAREVAGGKFSVHKNVLKNVSNQFERYGTVAKNELIKMK